MKKIILSVAFAISIIFSAQSQSQGTFVFLTTFPMIQDSASPVLTSDSAFIAKRYASIHPRNDSVVYRLIGQGSKSASNLSDSLIMPIPFKNGYTSGIMDLGIRCDSVGLDSILIYQSNSLLYTYNGKNSTSGYSGYFKTADVYFPFVSGPFIVPTRFSVKPVLSRSSSKKRTIYVNPNYYQQ